MKDLGDYLFTFAVISDSHVNEEEGSSASPYACNRLANGRFRHVIHDLNRRRPAFTVHLGDMGNPLPELPTYRRAAERFRTIASELEGPLYLVAGNHCLGDKPGGWVPVPRISVESLSRYVAIHGRVFYSFDRGPCHFVVISSLLINSGLGAEDDQKVWLERDLATAGAAGKRIWVMMHYPAYVGAPDEPNSYDNVDEPGRSWLLHLFEEHDVEAVFSGHVHNYFYNRYAGTDLYTVPATSFVRQDYAELYTVAPEDDEGGRNETAKLGYGLVEVYDNGHVHRVVRSQGQVLNAGVMLETSEEPSPRSAVAVGSMASCLAVDLRQNWLRRVHLRPNNSVSPFTRRDARNDWALLALQEIGISRVRLALQELVRDDVVERMATLQEAGFEFSVYSHGAPRESDYRLIREHRSQLADWELIMSPGQVQAVSRKLSGVGLPCYLNEIRDTSQARLDDANVKHEAIYGFQSTEIDEIEELCRQPEIQKTFRGLVFRIRRRGRPKVTPWQAIQQISDLGSSCGMRHQAHILFSGNLTADRLEDDVTTANRVAEATLAGWAAGNVDVTFDTFEDVDRGYFVRHGLVDRLYNPRLAARVLRHLHAALSTFDADTVQERSAQDLSGGTLLQVGLESSHMILALPRKRLLLKELEGVRWEGDLRRIDLEDGTVSEVGVVVADSGLRFKKPVTVDKPILLIGL